MHSPEIIAIPARWAVIAAARRVAVDHGRRLLRFALVGASGVAVNMGVLAMLVEVAGLPHLIAAALATEVAILSNFGLNDRWTFGDARSCASWPQRAWRYNLVAAGGLLVSIGVTALLTQGVGWHYAVANLGGIGAGFAWNYAVNVRVTWSAGSAACSVARELWQPSVQMDSRRRRVA